MKASMTDEALVAALSEPWVAKLATHTGDGGIRMSSLWFRRDDDGSLLFATWPNTAAARNIMRNQRCSVLIDSEGGEPYYGVHLDGTAVIEGPPIHDERIVAIYAPYQTDIEETRAYVRRYVADAPMVLIRFMPTRIISWDFREEA